MNSQRTSLDKFIQDLSNYFSFSITGSWRIRSIGLISLLIGFYLASNIYAFPLQAIGNRVIVVIPLVIFIEFLIRLRDTRKVKSIKSLWLILDNLRIGITYAFVLEAFKLGS